MNVDDDALTEAVGQENIQKYMEKMMPEETAFNAAFGDYWTMCELLGGVYCSNNGSLSNGDEASIKLVPNEKLSALGETLESLQKGIGISFKKTEFTYTVEGCEDAELLDPFVGIEACIFYDGANGSGTASIEIPEDFEQRQDNFTFTGNSFYTNVVTIRYGEKDFGSITYYVDGEKLSAGDTITVSIKTEALWEKLSGVGYMLCATEKDYAVPDLGEYITTSTQLSAADIEQMGTTAVASKPYSIFRYDWTFQSAYFGYSAAEISNDTSPNCFVVIVKESGGIIKTQYRCVYFYQLIQRDGSLISQLEGGGDGYNSAADAVAAMSNKYTYEKVA